MVWTTPHWHEKTPQQLLCCALQRSNRKVVCARERVLRRRRSEGTLRYKVHATQSKSRSASISTHLCVRVICCAHHTLRHQHWQYPAVGHSFSCPHNGATPGSVNVIDGWRGRAWCVRSPHLASAPMTTRPAPSVLHPLHLDRRHCPYKY